MNESQSLDELQEHIRFVQQKIAQIRDDVLATFKEDFPKFVEREVKRAFLENAEHSASMSEQALKALKAEMVGVGAKATVAVLADLTDSTLWVTTGAPESTKTLESNTELWAVVNGIADAVNQLLEKHGFPGPHTVAYKSPTWFIAGKYMPSLAEAYWRWNGDLSESRGKVAEMTDKVKKDDLLTRWDAT